MHCILIKTNTNQKDFIHIDSFHLIKGFLLVLAISRIIFKKTTKIFKYIPLNVYAFYAC